MRLNRPVNPVLNLRPPLNLSRVLSKSSLGLSVLALFLSGPAFAQSNQDSVFVDISDPNITIDLSVLDDGGAVSNLSVPGAPGMGQASTRTSAQEPGGDRIPVSTLYIQPSRALNIPPQTKPLLVMPSPKQKVAEKPPVVEPAPQKVVQIIEQAPPAPVVQETAPAPKPVEVVEKPKAVEAPAKAKPIKQAVVRVVPKPAPAPVVKVVEAIVAPKAVEKVVEKVITPPPPPAPMALTKSNKPKATDNVKKVETAAVPTPPQAPAPTTNVTVIDLPPKTSAAQPGVASLPSPTGPLSDGDNMRIVFDPDSSKLPQDARDALKALSDRMKGQDGLRLQLLAYAGTADMSASAARRLSLSRALAVRSHLIESGVRSTRIDVRALGNKSSDEITERVDITVVER